MRPVERRLTESVLRCDAACGTGVAQQRSAATATP